MHAARCTCKIAAKFRDGGVATGTAFFVSPTTLLTAAHLYDGPDTEIVAQEPGTLNTNVDIHGLFTGSPPVNVFKCVALVTQQPIADILLPDCSRYRDPVKIWGNLQRKFLAGGISVDLVGYPGLYSPQYLVDTQGKAPGNMKALEGISEFLPRCELYDLTWPRNERVSNFPDACVI